MNQKSQIPHPKSSRRRIIGLTGGIATGKTTVSNYLATAYQLPVLDADIYAREAVCVGSPVLEALREHYGSNILLPDGNLNRQQLGQLVFSSVTERRWLEQRIHPYVRSRMIEAIAQLQESKAAEVVLVVPLLFEAGMTDLVTEIWVVYCSREQQLERLMQRSQLTLEEAQARIQSQMPMAEKCDRGDIVLDNSCAPDALLKQVDAAYASPPTTTSQSRRLGPPQPTGKPFCPPLPQPPDSSQ